MFRSWIPWSEGSIVPSPETFSRAMTRMEEELEDLKARFFRSQQGWWPSSGYVPRADVVETENEFEVCIDLPGLGPDEVNVELTGGELWISGERKKEKEQEEGTTYHRMERRHGTFKRVLPLPAAVNEDKVEATFARGVLRITVPKTEKAKTKHIHVTEPSDRGD